MIKKIASFLNSRINLLAALDSIVIVLCVMSAMIILGDLVARPYTLAEQIEEAVNGVAVSDVRTTIAKLLSKNMIPRILTFSPVLLLIFLLIIRFCLLLFWWLQSKSINDSNLLGNMQEKFWTGSWFKKSAKL